MSRAVQLCVDIGAHFIAANELPAPATMGQTFDLLAQAGVVDTALADQVLRGLSVGGVDTIGPRVENSCSTKILRHATQS